VKPDEAKPFTRRTATEGVREDEKLTAFFESFPELRSPIAVD
jgi:hypothetical protein